MSIPRIATLLGADFAEYRRRTLFWVWGAVLLGIAWLFGRGSLTIASGDESVGGARAFITSEFAMAHFFGLGTLLFHGFFVAIVCGLPIVRDEELRIGEILHTTPLRRREYVWAKFGAALLACAAMLALDAVFTAFFNHAVPTDAPEIRGPFAFVHYARPIFVLALPTVVFIGGIAFALGTASRRAATVFVLPVALLLACAFVLWSWNPVSLNPRAKELLTFVDPTGFRWLQENYLDVDRGVAFYNHASVPWTASFLASRVGWAAVGLAAVALIARRPSARSPRVTRAKAASPPVVRSLATSPQAQRRPSTFAAIGLIARFELRALARQAGLYLFVPVILLTVLPGALADNGPFDSALLPTPGYLAQRCMPPLLTCTLLLLLFYVVESFERETKSRVAAMVYTTAVSDAAHVLGKVLANLVLGAAILGVAWLACVAILVFGGAPSKGVWPFILLWGVCGFPTMLAWIGFVSAVWTLTRQRFVAYGAGLLVMTLTGWLLTKEHATWLTNWLVWKSFMWSDISTLEFDRGILILNRLFVLSLGAALVAVAVVAHRRTERDDVHSFGSWRALRRPLFRLLPFVVTAVGLGVGVWLSVQGGYESDARKRTAKDYWRQNVVTYRDAPAPDLTFVDLAVDLDPPRSAMRVAGSYVLRNDTKAPMRHVLLTLGAHMRSPTFSLDGRPFVPKNRSNLYVFTPDTPLAPGAQAKIGFAYEARLPDGPSAVGGLHEEFILPSGVVLTSLKPTFAPVVGFCDDIGIDEKNNTEPRVYEPDFYAGITRAELAGAGAPFRTRIRITTPSDMMANSVGVKTEDVVVGGRRTVLWESDEPVSLFNVVAGRWQVREGTGTAIYYDSRHAMNVPEMSLALESARKYYSDWFYPFPWKTLKLSEFSGLAVYAQGFPTNITFSENIGFLAAPGSEDNLVFWIVAHETAHQWWPNLFIPGEGPGSPVLSEGLSHFSAMLLLEAVKGDAARRDFAKRIEHHYATTRVADAEQPLVAVDASGDRKGLSTVWYDRGGWALWMLMQTMGRSEMFSGLHAFIDKYRVNEDHPALHDFFEVLRVHAKDPTAFDETVHQWFEEVTLPRFVIVAAEKERIGAHVRTHGRIRNAGTGTVRVDVEVTAGDKHERTTVPLTSEAEGEFSITTEFDPERVVVDPDVMILQLGRKGTARRL